MKLSKKQLKNHQLAEEYLAKDTLTFEEKIFVLEHWHEGAENINSSAGAFFTPMGLAQDFTYCSLYKGAKVIDLCAGIGMLSFFAYHYQNCEIVCVELNSDYTRVGKKILPEATWLNCSITDDSLKNLPLFDIAISNPPFGLIKTAKNWEENKYKGKDFEFITMDIASRLAQSGSFIVPQNSTPFRFSGETMFRKVTPPAKLQKFLTETGLTMQLSASIDTEIYLKEWKGVSPLCEVIDIEFKAS